MAAKKKTAKKTINKVGKKPAKKPTKKVAASKVKSKKLIKKPAKQLKKVAAKKPTSKKISKKSNLKSEKKSSAKKSPTKAIVKSKTALAKPNVVVQAKKENIDYTKAITPLLDRLVVRVLESERVTAGGLIIPDAALMATGYLKAEVLAVGSGAKSKKGHLKPLDVKIGDKVLFAEYAGTKVNYNTEDLQIIHESDVMGILED